MAKPFFKIALPDQGLAVTGPQRSGKTLLLYAYLKEIAARHTGGDAKILVICDPYGLVQLHEDREYYGIPTDAIRTISMNAKKFPDVADYETVAFAITLNAEREAYYQSSSAYEEFVARLNNRLHPPFTMILVDSN